MNAATLLLSAVLLGVQDPPAPAPTPAPTPDQDQNQDPDQDQDLDNPDLVKSRSLYGLGVELCVEKKFAAAKLKFDAALKLDPRYAAAAYMHARCLLEDGPSQEAAASLLRALNLRPGDTDIMLQLAEVHRHLGQASLARGFLSELEKHKGRTPSLLRELLALAMQEEKPRRAAALLQEWRKLEPKNADVHQRLVDLHLSQNDLPAALRASRAATQALPDDRGAASRLIYLLNRHRLYEEAAEHLEALVKKHPQDVNLRKRIVAMYVGPLPRPAAHDRHQAVLKRLEARAGTSGK